MTAEIFETAAQEKMDSFLEKLLAAWPPIVDHVNGLLPPDAWPKVKNDLDVFIKRFKDDGLISDYSVECDRRTNPPSIEVRNAICASVTVKAFGRIYGPIPLHSEAPYYRVS